MSKVLLAVNTLTSVGSQAYASHLNAAFRMGKTDDQFLLFNGWRTSIDRFRNQAAKIALQNECDFLLFLDDDVLIPNDTYVRLKKRMENPNVDVITPVVYIRSYPFRPMFFKSVISGEERKIGLTNYEDWQEALANPEMAKDKTTSGIEILPQVIDGMLEVAAIGFSCCLLRVSLLKEIQPAWFVTGTDNTEDVYFCMKAKTTLGNRGIRVGIYVDTEIHAGHMLDPEFVSSETVKELKHFYEEMNPGLAKKSEHGDHGPDYMENNLSNLQRLNEIENLRVAVEDKFPKYKDQLL